MAWKYTGGSSAGIDSIGAGIKVAQSQKEQNRVSTEKNKEAIKANNLKDIAKQGAQWAKITGAGDPSSDTKWTQEQNQYFSGLISDYSNITEMMNRGENVDDGSIGLKQIDKKLDDYVKFVQLSNGLKDRVIEAGEFEKGSVGAIVSDGTINDVPATLMIRDLWENPEGMKLQDDEFGNLILSRGDQRINIVEFNDSLEDGRDLLATIQDPSDLQTTAMTGILDSLDNNGKITSSYSGDGYSSKKSYYNMPSIENAFRTKNPFKSLTTNPETAAGYWELLGDEINGGEAWIGTEEQKQRFTEAWNKRTIDKLIPQDQRSSAMKATVTSYTKQEEKGDKGKGGLGDKNSADYTELININDSWKEADRLLRNPSGPLPHVGIKNRQKAVDKSILDMEKHLTDKYRNRSYNGKDIVGFKAEMVDLKDPKKGLHFKPKYKIEIPVTSGVDDSGKPIPVLNPDGSPKMKYATKFASEWFDVYNMDQLTTFENNLKQQGQNVTNVGTPALEQNEYLKMLGIPTK